MSLHGWVVQASVIVWMNQEMCLRITGLGCDGSRMAVEHWGMLLSFLLYMSSLLVAIPNDEKVTGPWASKN